jgi:hypothetical protein
MKKCRKRVGSPFSCRARYIRVPGSWAFTYRRNTSIAFFTRATPERLTGWPPVS